MVKIQRTVITSMMDRNGIYVVSTSAGKLLDASNVLLPTPDSKLLTFYLPNMYHFYETT